MTPAYDLLSTKIDYKPIYRVVLNYLEITVACIGVKYQY